jgi:N-acetylated-alpha-linked acidic dipeptidase
VLSCAFAAFAAQSSQLAGQSAPVRGFPADALAELARREQILRSTPDTSLLHEYIRTMSEDPHHAGSPGSKAVAEYVRDRYLSWGVDTWIEEFQVLLPTPIERHVELLGPNGYVARLEETAFPEDKDAADAGQLPTYNAFSADGDVTGELVFVNYGLPQDYETLDRMGIDVTGKVVIAKYGRSWRGIKPKVAAEHGAIACIIYSDPEEDGYYVDEPYPVGPMRPEHGVQRGSVMDMPLHPGDPLTPGWGSSEAARRLDRSEATTIMKIPVLPISYGDAMPLLRALGGPVAPNNDWKGALPITYHVGPGPATVRVALSFDWQVRSIYDVFARIPGSVYPDQWVIHGNHHDAWVNGAQDPLSGASTVMESVRSFSELVKTGWRQKRTMIFALWDAEEWGLIGSTEWGEEHADELRQNGVAYFNTDSYSRGWYGVQGSHTLETFFRELARDTRYAETGGTALEALVERDLERARNERDSTRAREREFKIGALGSGSDYTVFIDHLNIASANIGIGGAQSTGIYHSIYDSYDFFMRYHDPTFSYGKTLAGSMAMAMIRMADAPILPFSFSDAALTYADYVSQISSLADREFGKDSLDMTVLRTAVSELAEAGMEFDAAVEAATAMGSALLDGEHGALEEINGLIYKSERDLGIEAGLPRRSWFRHMIYAPGFYTGYGVKTIPAVREAVEQGDLDEARQYASLVAGAIMRMAQRVREVTGRLQDLP